MAAEVSKPDFSFQWASGGGIVAPSDVKVQTGWTAEVPPFQWENWSQNRQDNAILHLFQKGISEWDSASNYYFTASGVRSYVQGSDGTIYVAVQDNTGQNPVTDVSFTYWKPAFPTTGRLLRTTAYINIAGVLQISVDGASFVAAGSSSFTKHPLAVWADAEVQGSGGGGGSANSTAAGQVAAGSGGGGGGYSRKRFAIAALNGQSITIGAGAAANTSGNSSSIGILVTASGGGAGINGGNVTPSGLIYEGRPGGVGSGGDLNAQGGFGFYAILGAVAVSGKGGSSMFGDGGSPATGIATTGSVGNAGLSYGSGGSGAANGASVPTSKAGGTGASGIIIIREYA